MSQTVQQYKADFFKALGHPQRLALLERLVEGPAGVSALAAAVDLDPSNTSRHLAQLRTAGVIEAQRSGTAIVYRLAHSRTGEIMAIARQIMGKRLEATQELLKDLTAED